MNAQETRVQLSIIKNNGREIFQQERVDKGHRETGNELADGTEEARNNVLMMEWRGNADESRWVLNRSGR
jgi:hypothetical protein